MGEEQSLTIEAEESDVSSGPNDTEDRGEDASEESLEGEESEDPEKLAREEFEATGLTLEAAIEALLFANGEPLAAKRIAEILPFSREEVDESLRKLGERLEGPEHGVKLFDISGKFQIRTKGSCRSWLQALKAGRPRRLSGAALETLAIVAYRQPIPKADVEKIRGVDATPTMKTLLERKLITIVGHKATVGQPALYGTTDDFLKLFGLSSLSELPSLRELKELEEHPGEEDEELVSEGGDEEGAQADDQTPPTEESEGPVVANG